MLKKLARLMTTLVIAALLCGAGALWWLAGQFVSPERAPSVQLPQNFPYTVSEVDLVDGTTPTLIVEPLAGRKSPRADLLQGQVRKMGGEPLTAEGEKLLVLLHGRMGRKEYLLRVAERYCALGFICVIPDLPAHGESTFATNGFGVAEHERGLVATVADEVMQHLGRELPVSLWGMSMGGSFAMQAAADDPEKWEGIVLVSTFDSLESLLDEKLDNRVYSTLAKPFVRFRGRFDISDADSIQAAAKIKAPVFLVHGDADKLISIKRAEGLYNSLKVQKDFMTVEGGTHQNVLITDAPVYARTGLWLLKGGR